MYMYVCIHADMCIYALVREKKMKSKKKFQISKLLYTYAFDVQIKLSFLSLFIITFNTEYC